LLIFFIDIAIVIEIEIGNVVSFRQYKVASVVRFYSVISYLLSVV